MPATTRPVRVPLKSHIIVTDTKGNDIIIKRVDIRTVAAYQSSKGPITTIYFYNRLRSPIEVPVTVRHFYNYVLYPVA